jgi:ferric-dicitrate binding protein FerR (iron transport regulator)
VEQKQKLEDHQPDRAWTRPEAYLGALARKRSFRRAREDKPRTQPEAPRLLLSTLPFLALIVLLAVLAVAIMIVAFPGNQPQPKPKQVPQQEKGVAQRGWFEEAQKQFHH